MRYICKVNKPIDMKVFKNCLNLLRRNCHNQSFENFEGLFGCFRSNFIENKFKQFLSIAIIFISISLSAATVHTLRPQIAQFWQGKDLSSLPADSVEQMTVDYIYIAQHADSLTRSCMLDSLAARWQVKPLANAVLDYLGNYDSPMFNEEMLIQMLERMNLDAPEAVSLKYIYDGLLKNRVGTATADFEFTDEQGNTRQLSDVAKGRTLLLFYDPDCDVCHELMNRMAVADKLPWHVVAVSVDASRLTPGLPASWISGRADGELLEELYPFSHYPYAMILNGMQVEARDAEVKW